MAAWGPCSKTVRKPHRPRFENAYDKLRRCPIGPNFGPNIAPWSSRNKTTRQPPRANPPRLTRSSQIGTSKIGPIFGQKMTPCSSCSKTIRKPPRPRFENAHNKFHRCIIGPTFDPQMVFRPCRLTKHSQIGTSKIEPIFGATNGPMEPMQQNTKKITKIQT